MQKLISNRIHNFKRRKSKEHVLTIHKEQLIQFSVGVLCLAATVAIVGVAASVAAANWAAWRADTKIEKKSRTKKRRRRRQLNNWMAFLLDKNAEFELELESGARETNRHSYNVY